MVEDRVPQGIKVKGKGYSPLLSICGATSGMLCPVWAPNCGRDICKLKSTQRKAAKLVPGAGACGIRRG